MTESIDSKPSPCQRRNDMLSVPKLLKRMNLKLLSFSKNIHRNHRTSLSIGRGIVMVLRQVITEMFRYGL